VRIPDEGSGYIILGELHIILHELHNILHELVNDGRARSARLLL